MAVSFRRCDVGRDVRLLRLLFLPAAVATRFFTSLTCLVVHVLHVLHVLGLVRVSGCLFGRLGCLFGVFGCLFVVFGCLFGRVFGCLFGCLAIDSFGRVCAHEQLRGERDTERLWKHTRAQTCAHRDTPKEKKKMKLFEFDHKLLFYKTDNAAERFVRRLLVNLCSCDGVSRGGG